MHDFGLIHYVQFCYTYQRELLNAPVLPRAKWLTMTFMASVTLCMQHLRWKGVKPVARFFSNNSLEKSKIEMQSFVSSTVTTEYKQLFFT